MSPAVSPGEVHAIIGENGAGKSTLMKLLAGHLQPTRGELRFDGKTVTLTGPVDAERRGIVLVHQEILLAPDLTVAQNPLGRELPGPGRRRSRHERRRASGSTQSRCRHRSGRGGATSFHRAMSAGPDRQGASGSSPRGDLRRTDRFADADRDPGIAQSHRRYPRQGRGRVLYFAPADGGQADRRQGDRAARRPRCRPPSGERIATGRYGAPDGWSRRGQALS